MNLKAQKQNDKYGVVTVLNPDRTFNREFKISGKELADLKASGNGVPPGVTKDEWESGRAVVYGKAFDVGDVEEQGGALIIKTAEKTVNGRIIESFLRLEKGEWSGEVPNITVDPAVLDGVKVRVDPEISDKAGERAKLSGVTSIVDGVLVVN